jgi:hydroxyethylthiazole kinase-like uncharacterized protein yjeF
MPLPILSVAQMRAWESATWAAGQTETAVIEGVGKALADCALRLTCDDDLMLVLAGRGHNGDDARAALPHLKSRQLHLLNVTDPVGQLSELQAQIQRKPALVIDALFGIGLNRPLDTAWQQWVHCINDAHRPVLSVDVPSGLDADTGKPWGAAVVASLTLTVGAPKAGLLKAGAWSFVGRLEVASNVGLIPCPEINTELVWADQADFAEYPPARLPATHKGSYGHLAIVAGSEGYHGAAVLAARAAQRAQPGLLTLHTMPEVYWPAAAQLQSAMVRPWNPNTQLASDFSAVLIGPGLASPEAADALRIVTRKLWRDAKVPVIADASALDWLSADPLPKDALRVITPHPGEAARLLKTTADNIQSDRPHALREISRRFGDCWVVLKGHQTLVGRSTGEISVNSSGNPHLAQGGSGDVLSGYIAGLLAQPALRSDVGKTIRYAVWQHGATADQLSTSQRNWIIEDLVTKLGEAGVNFHCSN